MCSNGSRRKVLAIRRESTQSSERFVTILFNTRLTLDIPAENEVHEAWLVEASRRAAEIDSGKVTLVSGEQLEKEVQAILM